MTITDLEKPEIVYKDYYNPTIRIILLYNNFITNTPHGVPKYNSTGPKSKNLNSKNFLSL